MPAADIITENFPTGWRVEHRPTENVSILCRESDFSVGGLRAICLRPTATRLEQWLPIAITIATGFDMAYTPAPSEEDPHA